MKLNNEILRQNYKTYCMINNLVEHEQGFKGYVSDQRMLERCREARRKREQEEK